jgi:hypothetical protein
VSDVRFAISYTRLYRRTFALLGMGPRHSWIEVTDTVVTAQMGIWFRTRFPRTGVTGAEAFGRRTISAGVHGWGGRWLVNGSSSGITTIGIEPPVRAWVCGVPVRLRLLLISVEDPGGLRQALLARPDASQPDPAH